MSRILDTGVRTGRWCIRVFRPAGSASRIGRWFICGLATGDWATSMPGGNPSGTEQDEAARDPGQREQDIMGTRDPQVVAREHPAGLPQLFCAISRLIQNNRSLRFTVRSGVLDYVPQRAGKATEDGRGRGFALVIGPKWAEKGTPKIGSRRQKPAAIRLIRSTRPILSVGSSATGVMPAIPIPAPAVPSPVRPSLICPRFAGQFVKRHAPSLRTRLG